MYLAGKLLSKRILVRLLITIVIKKAIMQPNTSNPEKTAQKTSIGLGNLHVNNCS